MSLVASLSMVSSTYNIRTGRFYTKLDLACFYLTPCFNMLLSKAKGHIAWWVDSSVGCTYTDNLDDCKWW